MDSLAYNIVSSILIILLGVIGFFLKRTVDDVDKCEKDIKHQDECKADKTELKTLKDDVEKRAEIMKEDVEKRMDKLSGDIEGIKEDYITKEDFFREQAKTDRKLDMILDILLDRKGGKYNG